MTATGSSLATRFRWPTAWRDFVMFVRRPLLPATMTGIKTAAVRPILALLALDILASAAILALFLVLEFAGVDLPENVLEDEELTAGLLWLIAIVAPVIEELIFRSWLSGRPSAATIPKYAFIALLLVGAATGFGGPIAGLIGALIVLGLAIREAIRRRGRPAAEWYAKRFAWFYFGSAVLFASAHLFNYGEDGGGILTLLVVPQFIGGLVLGYARVTYGLWASIAMHVSFNSLLVVLMLAAERLA